MSVEGIAEQLLYLNLYNNNNFSTVFYNFNKLKLFIALANVDNISFL